MRLTTKGRYAVTAILDLAMHSTKSPVTLADIAVRQGISLAYLEQLFAKLKKKGLVISLRGPGGGYYLSRSSENIFIGEIIDAVNESVDVTLCHGKSNCQQGHKCLTHHLWCDLSEQIRRFLYSISLTSLLSRQEIRLIAMRQDQQKAANDELQKRFDHCQDIK
ncbi:MAG: Rrf2 family transcriptional regulator [Endozoicomonadaceae bacterium]|nr:Rrf2 family transcriptional regulator [Endozoicomonadaceae bacterium]MCY4329672.1 Rrf2 family transcriptional regulator [Endozoicomonadaceae bacterium]